MVLKDISLDSPEKNILYDDVLLALAEKSGSNEYLRFWESSKIFIVLGKIGKIEDDVNVSNVVKDRIPILRRSSGGGTVLQGKGCFNFSLILSKDNKALNDIRKSYRLILENIISILNVFNIDAKFEPASDLALISNNRKISGNAQKRGRNFILHHGTLLYDFDLGLIEKYLSLPKQMPEYRNQRPHTEFVANAPIRIDNLKEAFKKIYGIEEESSQLNREEESLLSEAVKSKPVIIEV